MSVKPSGLRIDELWQRVHVGVLQPGELPVLEYALDYGMLSGKGFEGVNVRGVAGGRFASSFKTEVLVQQLAQLLRRAGVEPVARELLHISFKGAQPLRQLTRQLREHSGIHADSRELHVRQHGHERQLHLPKIAHLPPRLQLGLELRA